MGGLVSGVGDLLGFGGGGGNLPKPTGLTTPGISVSPGGELTRSGGLQQTIESLSGQFGTQAEQLGGLRGQVTPGFGALTETAVQSIRNRRRQAIGNLRENLARRRVLGSSFAQDALSRAEAEFSQQEAQVRSQTKLQEIDATMKLINQEATARQNQFNTLLQQSNFEAQLGANVTSGINAQLQSNAQFEQQMASQQFAGLGQLAGTLGAAALLAPIAPVAPVAAVASDRRIKEDIEYKFNWNGFKWYTFRYIGSKVRQFGVMAQEVEKILPHAVKEINGVKHVDYEVIYG